MTRFRRFSTLSVLALGLLNLPSVVRAAGSADPGLRAMFEARYAELKAAMDRRDPKEVAAFWTVDFISEDTSGNTGNAAAMLKALAAMPVDPNRTSDTKVTSVSLKGDVATVEQQYRATTSRLKAGSRADQETVETRATSIDTWLRLGKTWLLQRTVTREIETQVDGRVVGHKTHV